ncbi:MAG: hypothetical protein RMM58_09010 [Chloroflexota bacterium]|nr:hypothetical protein [Dehalococcoidia bacterium]MDW8254005.1 hypothetical protein [Chloroflexota bacterium]
MSGQAVQNGAPVRRTRRLPVVVSALIAALTVFLASLPGSLLSAPQNNVAPAVENAAATELGRARQVAQFASNYRPEIDPIIQTSDGRYVKASNYHGVLIHGVRYYYHLPGHPSYDPIGRGEVTWNDVVIKERIQAADEFLIIVYTIPQ